LRRVQMALRTRSQSMARSTTQHICEINDGAGEWVTLSFRAILSFCPLGNVVREPAMGWFFSGRNAKLETMNRILTDAARKRAERIEELEDQLAQLERQTAHLKQELIGRERSDHAGYAKRIAELTQHNQQLVEAANKYALRIQELENEFTRISKLLCKSGDDPTSGS
jgi:DNA repair exonuclease SbcCD ATPase subunit